MNTKFTFRTRGLSCAMITYILICTFSVPALAQRSLVPPALIDEDQQWTGTVVIRENVTIRQATVRVTAGTTIRFEAGGATAPQLILSGGKYAIDGGDQPARLLLQGRVDRPIEVLTPPDLPAGTIVGAPGGRCVLQARYCHFSGLGSDVPARPAIGMELVSPRDDLWLDHCRFENCAALEVLAMGPTGTVAVENCLFADTQGRQAMLFRGGGSGVKTVRGNIADAALRIDCPQILIEDNVLIGPHAAIAVPSLTNGAIRIVGNYVHCTSELDDGRYVIKCDTADAVLADNVLIGGTYTVASAPRVVTGNVLVGVGGLQASFEISDLRLEGLKSTTTTHQLLAGLATGAEVRDNFFLGPAYAALVTAGETSDISVEHNIFDGWGQARRAIVFNVVPGKPVRAKLSFNVFTRYTQTAVLDQVGGGETLQSVGHNYFADIGGELYEKLARVEGLAEGDRRFDFRQRLGFKGQITTQAALDVEAGLRSRSICVDEVRRLWQRVYQPTADSQLRLVGEGEKIVGPRIYINP